MNKRRLLKLADLLEADAKNKKGIKFDLGVWGDTNDDKLSISCGTSACAVGLAVLSGAFKRAGLQNYHKDDGEGVTRICPAMPSGRVSFDAAGELFDLGHNATLFLFSDDFYPSGKTTGAVGERFVAKRIRDFVAGKAKP